MQYLIIFKIPAEEERCVPTPKYPTSTAFPRVETHDIRPWLTNLFMLVYVIRRPCSLITHYVLFSSKVTTCLLNIMLLFVRVAVHGGYYIIHTVGQRRRYDI